MTKQLFDTVKPATSNFSHERALALQGFNRIAGCDEAGRGPLAGPVVAASVILPQDCDPSLFIDSKQLTHTKRLELCKIIEEIGAAIGIGIVSAGTIDTINILQASLLAMKRSVEQLAASGHAPDYILVDGKFEIPLLTPQTALIKGESQSSSIAAASIVAKVTRDAIMDTLDANHPGYGFSQHKGYPTRSHRQAIASIGPSDEHRKTFRGVKEFVR